MLSIETRRMGFFLAHMYQQTVGKAHLTRSLAAHRAALSRRPTAAKHNFGSEKSLYLCPVTVTEGAHTPYVNNETLFHQPTGVLTVLPEWAVTVNIQPLYC